MKISFTFLVKGEDSLLSKINAAGKENAQLQTDFVRCVGQLMVMAFKLNGDDKVSIDNFQVSKVEDQEKMQRTWVEDDSNEKKEEIVEKKVDK